MCGIVGYVGQRKAAGVLIDCLSKLEYRGYDSAGVALFEKSGIEVIKATGRLKVLAAALEAKPELSATCGIGHTRWATHGAPSDLNSHPHTSEHVTLVHNGIIENYLKLKEMLLSNGYTFQSETDTEVLVKLFDFNYDGDPLCTILKTLSQVRGSYGLAIMFKDFPDRIYGVRKESPLIVGYGQGENFLASDIPALLKYTREYSILEEGQIAEVTEDKITIYDEFGNPTEKEHLTADWDVEAAEKCGYAHFMLKEIHEQPKAMLSTISPRIEDGMPDLHVKSLTDDYLRKVKRIHIVACGTAMHAGMVGKTAIERLCRVPVEVDIASEFRYRDPIIGEDELTVIISQSGETLDTLAALKLARAKGSKVLGIVNVVGSSIARESDDVIYTYAGPEIAVASTKAYSVQLAVLYLLALRMAYARNTLSQEKVQAYVKELLRLPELIGEVLEDSEQIKYLASQFMNCDDLFYLGRGFDYALSLEGSLKLKEISYVHSEAYAAGELKHGTISLIVEGTPVIALATQDDVFEKTISNVKEVKSRGAKVILFCKKGVSVPADVADYIVSLPVYEEIFMPMLTAVPLQLFAYYMAVLRGCDVDKPRNLAKSVTVE
ncbi:MAG: glutamine--fructose-6-phosphate transaminase (isomerizing) [Pygmaiobacter massiliensis]|nr:glutamine--fructose-6-phosphate transaminase (isomerizing) [Pygmaiobacter massiliensis]